MEHAPKRFALVALNQLDPFFRDGGSRSALDYLHVIRGQGRNVRVLTFVCQDYPRIQFSDALADPATSIKRGTSTCTAIFQGVEFIETILPVKLAEQKTRQATILQAILKQLDEYQVEFVLTLGEGYVPLLAGWLKQLPGAHVFQSPLHVQSFQRNSIYLDLLRTRWIVANSRFTQSLVEQELACPACTWYPPHDLSPFGVETDQPRTFAVGFSSSMGAVKGDDIVVKIITRLPEYRFIVVGENFSRDDFTAPNLTYLGHVRRMQDFYHQIDLLIVPSIWQEAFGRVILEAAASGLPVIANRRGGIPEAMGNSGVLIDFASSQSDLSLCADKYVSEIRRLFTDASLYADYQRKAFARAREFEHEQAIQARQMIERFSHQPPKHQIAPQRDKPIEGGV